MVHQADLLLASLDLLLRARLRGLPPRLAALVEGAWPAQSGPRPHVELELEAVDDEVGLPAGSLAEATARWTNERAAELVVTSGRATLAFEGGVIRGRGTVCAARAKGALESLFRATAAVALHGRGVFVVHAAVVRRGADALLLLGNSGAGKTTTARRLGREGFARLADDMVALDLAGERPPRVHALPFERGGRGPLAAALGAPPVCRGALAIRRGADAAAIGPAGEGPSRFAQACIALAPRPGDEQATLERFGRLCALPLAELSAPPSGPLAPTVSRWLEGLAAPAAAAFVAQASGRPTTLGLDRMPIPVQAVAVPRTPKAGPRVERAENVAWRVLDGAAVLVAPSSVNIQTLNAVGTRVWQLADGRALDEIVTVVVNEFEVERTQAEHDVACFVRDLTAKGLLTLSGPERT